MPEADLYETTRQATAQSHARCGQTLGAATFVNNNNAASY